MAYRVRGRGRFTAPTTRSGRSFVYDGRRVTIRGENFQINWDGPVVIAAIMDALQNAFVNLSDDALQYMQGIVPVDTGATRDSCFAVVSFVNGRLNLIIGAGTPYAIYIELGTSSHDAQPFIRPTFDYVISRIPGLLKSEVARRAR